MLQLTDLLCEIVLYFKHFTLLLLEFVVFLALML
jgi:hypothetical protein